MLPRFCFVLEACALAILVCGCGSDPALFHPLTSEETGVHFTNRVQDDPVLNIINYLYFYDGGGVAVGDVNGDSLPDLYFTANRGPNKLFLNTGGLQFEDVTEVAGVEGTSDWNTGVTMADVNGDGRLDIYVSAVDGVAGLESRNELFINNGDGSFTERAADFGLDFRGYATQAAFFDYDRDGDLDAYLLNHSIHDEQHIGNASARAVRHPSAGDRLFRNEGEFFVDVSEEAGIYGGAIGYGLGVSISDFDSDGDPDIYIGNDFHENDYLYENNGDGTFTERIQEAVAHNSRSSMGTDAADYNNDGLTDVVVLDMLPYREEILKTSASTENIQVSTATRSAGYHRQYEQNTLLLNRGDMRFSDIASRAGIAATDWSWAPLFCDLDNDGWKDLYVTNGIWRRPNDEDYLMTVASPAAQESLYRFPESSLQYIEKMPHERVSNFAYQNTGGLIFEDVSQGWGLAQEHFSTGAAYGDLDNDGDLDLVVNNLNEPSVVFENLGSGNYLSIRLEGPQSNRWGIGARVWLRTSGSMQMQELYPTRGFQSSVDPRLHFGLGAAVSIDTLVVVWSDGRSEMRTNIPGNRHITLRYEDAGDIDEDSSGDYGVAGDDFEDASARVSNCGSAEGCRQTRTFREIPSGIDFVHRENTFFDFTREPLIPRKASMEGPALAIGDVDGDGLDDLFVGGAKWQPSALMLQNPDGGFRASNEALWQADSLHEDVDAAFFDADDDGDLDLYVVSAGNEWSGEAIALRDRLYVNDGEGSFTEGALPPMFSNGSVVRPADFDGDGDVDLFIGGRVVAREYGTIPRSFLLRNEGGRFVEATPEVLQYPGMITDATWSDFNNDGIPDLAVVGEWMPARVFYQVSTTPAAGDDRTGTSSSVGSGWSAVDVGDNGWWSAIEAADLNGDGADDLVLGNFGLNSTLRANPDEPVRLYIGDFDANGETDHIFTRYSGGVSYPLAGREDLIQAFPSFVRRYPTYDSYGASTIEDIVSSDQLADARVLDATEFASMVAWNRGNEGFELNPLPIEAQFSPVIAILADDFDEDGHTDLVLAGNYSGLTPALGPADAGYGTFLKGDSEGGLTSVEPRENGLWFEGEIRELAEFRRADGTRVLVGARNDDSLQFFARPHGEAIR